MGRKSTYKQEIADAVCAQLRAGKSLRKACDGLIAWETVRDWAKDDAGPGFAAQYALATQARATSQAESMQDDYEAEPERGPDGKIDPGWVALQRLKIDTKKWMASKMLPKVYGDKIETTLKGDASAPLVFGWATDAKPPGND